MARNSSTPHGAIRKSPRHFFWDNKLHRVLRINRPANLVEVWCFSERKSKSILYTDYRNNAKVAVQTGTAAKILRVSSITLFRYIKKGAIKPPERSYAFDGLFGQAAPDGHIKNISNQNHLWWGEHSLMEAHDAMMEVRRGFKRKDGGPTPLQKIATKAEIHAAFNNSTTLYVKGKDDEFVPLFRQPNW